MKPREIATEPHACSSCGHNIRAGASDYGGRCWGCLTPDERAAWRAMEEQAGQHIPGDGRSPWEVESGD